MQPCWNEAKARAQGTKSKVKSTRWSSRQRWDAKERSKRQRRYSGIASGSVPVRGWRQAAPLEYVLDQRRMRRDARQKSERRPIASTMAVKCHPSESQTNRASTPPPLFFFNKPRCPSKCAVRHPVWMQLHTN